MHRSQRARLHREAKGSEHTVNVHGGVDKRFHLTEFEDNLSFHPLLLLSMSTL